MSETSLCFCSIDHRMDGERELINRSGGEMPACVISSSQARRGALANVPLTLREFPALNHGFFSYTAISPDSLRAAQVLCADLQAHFQGSAEAAGQVAHTPGQVTAFEVWLQRQNWAVLPDPNPARSGLRIKTDFANLLRIATRLTDEVFGFFVISQRAVDQFVRDGHF